MTLTVAATAMSLTLITLPAYANDEPVTAGTVTMATTPVKVEQALSRPVALTALYASYGALQTYDVYSTRQGLARGAREANPLMQGVVGNSGAFIAVKAGVTVGTIVAAERLWRKSKPAAIGLMIAANSVGAIVAANNARTLARLR